MLYCAGKDRALQLDGFMQRWYPAMSDAHWNESHLSRYDEYFGYWCFCRGGRQTSRHSRRSITRTIRTIPTMPDTEWRRRCILER
ncbi:PoNe immunity protein domain-containing protein [Sinorhizobium meliloti]|uniref:PoNe immunity protein domain-containing protein n=1 Tax=Rhizobium meliloti TaxID=382 RepID=UPI0034E53776